MTTTTGRALDQASLSAMSTAYAEARLLHAAVDLGVFELLAKGPHQRVDIEAATGLHPRFGREFLNALVALGLLERGENGYANSAASAEYLVPGGSVFLGGRVRTAGQRHYHTWAKLPDALRDGRPKAGPGGDVFARLYADPEQARAFLIHMDANNALVAAQLAEQVDWSGYQSVVDVGGARGNVVAQLVTAQPHLHGGVFELPQVEPFFDELMAERGLSERVEFYGGSFFDDPMPAADALVFGHVLHDWDAATSVRLLERARNALAPGGAVVIYDQMLDEDAPDLRSLIGSLNVALITEGGSEYTVADCRGWLTSAGLEFRYARPLERGNDTVVLAVRAS